MPPEPTSRSVPEAVDLAEGLEVVVRPATADDGPGVAAVHLAARRAAPMPTSVHGDAEVEAFLTRRIGEDEVWVAEARADAGCAGGAGAGVVAGGGVVGYARFTPTWLDDLYVAPAWAGRGVGSLLIEVVKARRPDGFSLWVFEINHPARGFYARHGLVEVVRTDGADNEEHEPDIALAWRPGPTHRPRRPDADPRSGRPRPGPG